ncbi:glycosyltransferase family 4 protein [Winogradskyella thalassocola]|uniref:Glycosyltransferase involved in cell wall bisynthesis n=1 Tax=Winogradskyella thalassocola TaxID=262004 RepID=A0A1G8KIV3_9FLAO|nr:glycosyltransferase family 4 protein [Winogradskyella thalassocola]SDI43361.1 Glycosyltransferase involved in cell wall bisynthesis [Winogradskyella thalassocola]
MKIVFLARYLPAEGSTTHMYAVADNLLKRGHSVYILSRGTGGDYNANLLYEKAELTGVQFIKLPFPLHNKINFLTRFRQLVSYLFAIPFALFQLYKIKPDVIHAHYPVTTYLAAIYRFLTGKKFIVTHHNMKIPKHIFNRQGDYVIAISRELESSLISNYNYKKNAVKLIFNGVKDHKNVLDNNSIIRLKEINHIPKDRIVFGFVGTINKRKGIDILINAFKNCKDLKIHLIILGNGNMDWLNGLIDENKLRSLITLIPFRDPSDIYNMIDVLILPSRVEGFPLVPLEAMMMKKSVIRSNIEGAQDQIIEGENGFLFESENSSQLANIIKKITLNPEILKELGENAYQRAINNFSEESMVDELVKVYNLTK